MKADARIGLHVNSGRISVQTVEGHILMHAGSQTFDLPKGRVVVLDRSVPMTWKLWPTVLFYSQLHCRA
jgi:hypothetical protein